MASSALEEKINKIRQQNEEIRRRHEEVEEDKKNAAKLNALVKMVPSTDWPERKEPPEFSNPPRVKQKAGKEKHEYVPQNHSGEGKKGHTFAQGEGPPPDPKYNFLADSEREESGMEHTNENLANRTHNKQIRGNFKKRGTGRESLPKDNRVQKGNYRDDQPGYDAWRAERNRIDEDRISRQRTAEGNWRREWDNDKMHIASDAIKGGSKPTLGDFAKKDHKDFDRKYHVHCTQYVNRNRGGNQRGQRRISKILPASYEIRAPHTSEHDVPVPMKAPLSPNALDERTVIATDKSLKVTLNHGNSTKGPVMSVKVNAPSIAGTGRVGPRQRSRVTYSQSEAKVTWPEVEAFPRQASFEDKSKGAYFNNHKPTNLKRTHSQKKEDSGSKSPYFARKDTLGEGNTQMHEEGDSKSSYPQKGNRDLQSPYATSKSPRPMRKAMKPYSARRENNNEAVGDKVEEANIEVKDIAVVLHGDLRDETVSNSIRNELDVEEKDIGGVSDTDSKEEVASTLTNVCENAVNSEEKNMVEVLTADPKNESISNVIGSELNRDEENNAQILDVDSKNESASNSVPAELNLGEEPAQISNADLEDKSMFNIVEMELSPEKKQIAQVPNGDSKKNSTPTSIGINSDCEERDIDQISDTDLGNELSSNSIQIKFNNAENSKTSPPNSVSPLLNIYQSEESADEVNTKYEFATEKEKEENIEQKEQFTEITETELISGESTQDIEQIAKDTNIDDEININTESTKETVNSKSDDPQDECDLSSHKFIINQVESQGAEIVPNESNKPTDDMRLEGISMKEPEERPASDGVSESPLNSNCDNIKDSAVGERQGTIFPDNFVLSTEAEMCSVIESINRAVCGDEIAASEATQVADDGSERNSVEEVNAELCSNKNSDDAIVNNEDRKLDDNSIERGVSENIDNKVESQSKSLAAENPAGEAKE